MSERGSGGKDSVDALCEELSEVPLRLAGAQKKGDAQTRPGLGGGKSVAEGYGGIPKRGLGIGEQDEGQTVAELGRDARITQKLFEALGHAVREDGIARTAGACIEGEGI